MVGDRQGGYTEVGLPKILFWGVRRNLFSPIKLLCGLVFGEGVLQGYL
jgi:hypothetical protein